MAVNSLNRKLLSIVLVGGVAYGLLGLGLDQIQPDLQVELVIDRSYCAPERWQAVVERYQTLYQQHQRKQLTIASVTLVNGLGQEALETLPTTAEVAGLSTFGMAEQAALEAIAQANPTTTVLSCNL